MAGIDFIHQNGVDYEIVPEIAPLFKTTVNYAVGDCVIYNAEAYRFKTAHLAGAWIGTDAEKFLVGEELGAIKEDLSHTQADLYLFGDAKPATSTATGWKLNDNKNGLCSADASYQLVKYEVIAGAVVKAVTDGLVQFQNSASVPSSGTPNRVGITYDSGTHILEVPTGATYIIFSVLKDSGVANLYDGSSIANTTTDLRDDLSEIFDLKENLAWAKGYWSNGRFVPNTSEKRRTQTNIWRAPSDVVIKLSDYSLYRFYIEYFTSEGTLINETLWQSGKYVISKDSYVTVTIAYISSSAIDSDNIKNAVYDALTMQTASNYEGMLDTVDDLSENTKNMLKITNGIADSVNGFIWALDLGENKTFQNGVTFSFDATDLVVSATNNALIDLQKEDATHQYCTYNSLCDLYGNAFVNTSAQNGRFSTAGFSTYENSITFRYCIIRTNSITSGSISNFMLVDGRSVDKYTDKKTAIDYVARNRINDKGADFLTQSAYKINGTTTKAITFLHFSDIHGDTARLLDIINFKNTHDNITDILHTGDTVAGTYTYGKSWWDDVASSQIGAEKILNTIGNHDCLVSQSSAEIVAMSTIADTFIDPYISNWGVADHTTDTTYYYKDYDNGVRLIVLDCMHMDVTQLAWFTSALVSAKTANKHVVVAYHYYAYPHTVIDCAFSPKVAVDDVHATIPLNVLSAVDDFQAGGGKFVCYLTGHNHYDIIVTPTDYPNQLVVGITCATNLYAQCKFSDQSRVSERFASAFNLVTINPVTKTISVRRIGADMDMLGRDRIGMAYDYNAHQLLF